MMVYPIIGWDYVLRLVCDVCGRHVVSDDGQCVEVLPFVESAGYVTECQVGVDWVCYDCIERAG